MYAQYGSFTHPDNEVTLLSVNARMLRNARNIVQVVRKSVQLQGVYVLDTSSLTTAQAQTAIKTAAAEREAAYSRDGLDFGFYHDDDTLSAHYLLSNGSVGGVRVIERSFPNGDGAEYATQRTFSVTLEADYQVTGVEIVEWNETVEITGTGGPREILIETATGTPQRQTVNQRTKVTMVQRGSAVGFRAYLSPPGPIAPQLEILPARSITRGSAQRSGNTLINWPISWSYFFESGGPMSGLPSNR